MMKRPKFAALGVQKMLDAGLNGFAAQLLAESFADKPEKFGDQTVMLMAKAHNGTPVYMIVSTQMPDLEQFASWPTDAKQEDRTDPLSSEG